MDSKFLEKGPKALEAMNSLCLSIESQSVVFYH